MLWGRTFKSVNREIEVKVWIGPLKRTSRGALDGRIRVRIRIVHIVVDWRVRMQIS